MSNGDIGAARRVRLDKWLWAARFYKTRALASRACELGRIEVNGMPAKASREVRTGDALKVRNDSGEFSIEVLVAASMRGSPSVAQTFYREGEESRAARLRLAEERKAAARDDIFGEGRPSKRDRREINRFRGR